MSTVSLKNIYKIYDNSVTAVSDFNLEIADKEFIVLVGPSGCGKSTTLRMVAGLEEISKGELYIDGKLVNDVEPKDRDIAMVFQSYALYPHMTVRENMAFPLKLQQGAQGGDPAAGATRRRRSWTSPSIWTGSPRRCPAASGSVWPSGEPLSGSPRCC